MFESFPSLQPTVKPTNFPSVDPTTSPSASPISTFLLALISGFKVHILEESKSFYSTYSKCEYYEYLCDDLEESKLWKIYRCIRWVCTEILECEFCRCSDYNNNAKTLRLNVDLDECGRFAKDLNSLYFTFRANFNNGCRIPIVNVIEVCVDQRIHNTKNAWNIYKLGCPRNFRISHETPRDTQFKPILHDHD